MAWSRINYVETDLNMVINRLKGMDIYIGFEVHGFSGRNLDVSAYYYFSPSRIPLKAFNTYYSSGDGSLAVHKNAIVTYNDTIFDDFTLFMPYTSFNLLRGMYELMFQVIVWERSQGSPIELARSNFYTFNYTQY